MTTKLDEAVLIIRRTFDATPSDVFSALTSREGWQSWMGPEGSRNELPLFEPHVGGRYRFIMHLSDGRTFPVSGRFEIIETNKLCAFTWKADGGEHDSLVTFTLRAEGSKTELILRHDGLLTAESRDNHGQGWNSALNKLPAYLAGARA